MKARRAWVVVLATTVGMLAVLLLLAELGAPRARAQGGMNPRPLTADGRSRFAGWSPDGRTMLVNRWGVMAGDGSSRQTLSELWAVDVQADPEMGGAVKLSGNAVRPAYAGDGKRLAYLAFAGGGRWEVRVLELGDGYKPGNERAGVRADWRMAPAWIDGQLAFMRDGHVRLGSAGATFSSAPLPALPAGARIRLSKVGARIAWSDGAHLWVSSPQWQQPRLLVSPRTQPSLSGERETGVRVLSFAWSPDGRRLAYVVADGDLSPGLWVADVTSEEAPRLLVRGEMEMFSAPSWSPDGQQLAFSRAPQGSGTASGSDIWLVDADGSDPRALLHNDLEESSPAWSPDGRHLAFNRAGDAWILDLSTSLRTYESVDSPARSSASSPMLRSPTAQHIPPLTIRVIHHEENFYRVDVPVGQIDVITFENYVKRCVPLEMPALWPLEAVKVQAVAARTYAWFHVLARAGEDWDVSDWTDYQVMGSEDDRHPRSDAAADATQGQYVAYQGGVIKAFYSANNSSPTRSAAGYDYIRAVDDPVCFRDERRGHGWGMSQYGARRWAKWHGWGYQQILAHYYTGVTVELPSTGGPMPIGGVTLPWSDYFVTSNRVAIAANASDEAGEVTAVGFYVTGVATAGAALAGVGLPVLAAVETRPTLLLTDTIGADGWCTVWDVSHLSDTTTTRALTLSLLVADGAGNVQTQTQAAHIGLDRQPPVSITAAIQGTYTDAVTVTLSSLSAVDPSPGSGVQAMAFSNEGWAWEGEALSYLTSTAEVVTDADALNGWALRGLSATHTSGAWYTDTYALPPGRAYRAYFRLKTHNVATRTEVATLEVVDDENARLLGIRRLGGVDFRTAGVYQEFPVDFNYPVTRATRLELRTTFRAATDLYLDRVLVVSYPVAYAGSAQWQLTPGEGLKTVTVKFIDGAGNVSADVTTTVTIGGDTSPPTGWQDFAPGQWDGGPPPTCTVRVFDEGSGLNVDSARYRFSMDGGEVWSDWLTATCTGISGTTEVQTITTAAVPFDLPRTGFNQVQFRIADMEGLTSTSTFIVRGPLRIDGPATGAVGAPYTFTVFLTPITGTVAAPITYTWQAAEQARVVNRGDGVGRAVFTWTTAGPKTVVVTATNAEAYTATAVHTVVMEWHVYLSVDGPMAGGVGTPYTFTAAINSITGTVEPPFTYTWQAAEQARLVHTSGSVDRAAFTWITAGFKTVAVTATNVGGYAGSAVHTIEIGAHVYLPLVMRN